MQRMEKQQEARDAAVAARKAQMDAAFRLGGGDALCASLAEQALADEAKAQRQAAAHEAAEAAKVQREREARAARTAEQLSVLKAQVRGVPLLCDGVCAQRRAGHGA